MSNHNIKSANYNFLLIFDQATKYFNIILTNIVTYTVSIIGSHRLLVCVLFNIKNTIVYSNQASLLGGNYSN